MVCFWNISVNTLPTPFVLKRHTVVPAAAAAAAVVVVLVVNSGTTSIARLPTVHIYKVVQI
jgi:hypothetical protein